MDDRETLLARTAARQHGSFTRAQAVSSGFSDSTIDDRVRRGLYQRLEPSVFALAADPPSWQRSLVACVLSLGGLAAASHATAAHLWGMLSSRPDNIEVVTTRWDRVRRSAMVHESLDLTTADIVTVDGIPVTTPARTVVDLGATLRWAVASALDTGLRKELFTLDEVDRFVARVAKRGRRGVGVVRPLIRQRRSWDNASESDLEDRFRRIVGASTLPMPVAQYEVRTGEGLLVCRADFAYPDDRVLIELDGMAYHSDAQTFQRDRTKQNLALAEGWRTARFTWDDVVNNPAGVLRVLADIVPGYRAEIRKNG